MSADRTCFLLDNHWLHSSFPHFVYKYFSFRGLENFIQAAKVSVSAPYLTLFCSFHIVVYTSVVTTPKSFSYIKIEQSLSRFSYRLALWTPIYTFSDFLKELRNSVVMLIVFKTVLYTNLVQTFESVFSRFLTGLCMVFVRCFHLLHFTLDWCVCCQVSSLYFVLHLWLTSLLPVQLLGSLPSIRTHRVSVVTLTAFIHWLLVHSHVFHQEERDLFKYMRPAQLYADYLNTADVWTSST